MIKIETVENGKATNVQLQGVKIVVLKEMINIAQHLSQEDDDYADALLMGIFEVIPKDDIIKKLNRMEKSKKETEELLSSEKGIGDTLKALFSSICEVNQTKAKSKKRKGDKINDRD